MATTCRRSWTGAGQHEGRCMGSLIVLALNSGSSSLKFGLHRVDPTGAEKLFGESVSTAGQADAMTCVASVLAASGMPPPDAIGHRIVHGGPALRQPGRIDAAVLRQLKAASAFAPLPAAAGPGALSRNKTFRIAKQLPTQRFFANACPGHGVGMLMRNKRRAAPSVSPPPRGGGRRKAAALGALSMKCGSATFLDPLGGRPAAAGLGALINDGASHCQVLVLGSREDEQIARHPRTFLR